MTAKLPARPDKWYLGAGDGLLWAPPFPQWLEAPGFWDEAHLYQYAIRPLFTVSFLAGGELLPVRCRRRQWIPGALTLEHSIGALRAREVRAVAGGAIGSSWEITNPTRRPLTIDVVAWTAVDGDSLAAADVTRAGAGLAFVRAVTDRQQHRARIAHQLVLSPAAHSFAAYRSEASTPILPPQFELTPFFDRWSGRLDNALRLEGLTEKGLVFLGLHRHVTVAPKKTMQLDTTMTVALEGDRTVERRHGVAKVAAKSWRSYFASLPTFRCSDPYLERYWLYRWYGLKLHALEPGAPNYRHRTVTEGIAYFHVPITYSAQCHLRELRWLADPGWARGVLRTFLDHQKPDGSLHGRIYADHLAGTDFYHADWGGALAALDAVHPDPAFLAEAYPGLARYGAWLATTRDGDASGMLDVANHYETGQEYMSRYQAVDPGADRAGWTGALRLKGVDITVYGYRLFRALERMAADTAPGEVARWRAAAERSAHALRERMWDGDEGMFSDVNGATGKRTGVKAAVCFYPYATDVTDASHTAGLARHLFNPREFWTPYPVPSSAADDPLFSADAEWQGKRHNCPWNGRVWPMTNAHVADALAHVVRTQRPDWAPRLGDLLRRFFRMMTFDGRADRQNCFEHYHPYNGRGSVYRGIDDYQHSWVNDLLVSHVIGVLPRGAAGVAVQPLAVGVERASLDGIRVAGHNLRVHVAAGRFRVWVNGRAAGAGKVGVPLEIAF
ncbi:MAG TPA: hypothetical protein VNH63_05495 [Gemmatimonadales bacterium]|nr:hypothetical protein [Gemmatimonadales bacterium]